MVLRGPKRSCRPARAGCDETAPEGTRSEGAAAAAAGVGAKPASARAKGLVPARWRKGDRAGRRGERVVKALFARLAFTFAWSLPQRASGASRAPEAYLEAEERVEEESGLPRSGPARRVVSSRIVARAGIGES